MSPPEAFDDLTARARPETRAPSAFTLLVVEGPDRGAELKVDGSAPSRVLVGQSPACALRLTDRLVSRRHAALDLTERGLRLTDLSSTNGTFVNGLLVIDGFLQGGELVRVGDTSVRVEACGEAVPGSISSAMRFGRLIGGSVEMRRLYPLCERIAQSSMPVLIEGETGTGKEMLAEALHECGPRAAGPFVVFDCTAVPPNLLESTLFGHERGAYTGAVAARKGVFEQAHTGTLLIDEIGDLDLALQPKLLRAIERSEVQRVGGSGFVRCDARVLCATRRDLDREVAAGRFRDDLYFRITVARIELPPLRQRAGDIDLLCRHFWRALGGEGPVPTELLRRAEDYPWPGNVRELYNAVVRWRALGDLGLSEVAAPVAPLQPPPQVRDLIEDVLALDLPFPASRDRIMSEFERRYVERVLALHGGSVARAAEASGIARRYFQIIRARQK
jgi:DNA-binding NtrC family response regulator